MTTELRFRPVEVIQKWSSVIFLAVSLISCGGKDLPDYVKLGDLRVLALIANTPEVNPGATVILTPILSDINGNGRNLTYTAEACIDPGIGYGATPTCQNSSSRVVLATQTPVAGLTAPNYTGATTSTITASIPSTVLDLRTSIETYNGVAYLITYKVEALDGTTVSAFKRILVSTKTSAQLNLNPQVTAVLSGTTPLSTLPTSETRLSPSFGAVASETYSEMQSNGTLSSKTETLSTTWFISDGNVAQFRTLGTDSTLYTPPSLVPSGRNVIFVVVTRDGRGGEGYYLMKF